MKKFVLAISVVLLCGCSRLEVSRDGITRSDVYHFGDEKVEMTEERISYESDKTGGYGFLTEAVAAIGGFIAAGAF